MYKATLRAAIRFAIGKLNDGDATLLLKLARPDAVIAFPGDNSWATMFRPVDKGRERHATHQGLRECEAFADRFTSEGVQFELEDILVNGPPWNTRVAMRVKSFKPGPGGPGSPDDYNNRAMAVLELRWGRLVVWEDYEDTQRVAAWDQARAVAAASA